MNRGLTEALESCLSDRRLGARLDGFCAETLVLTGPRGTVTGLDRAELALLPLLAALPDLRVAVEDAFPITEGRRVLRLRLTGTASGQGPASLRAGQEVSALGIVEAELAEGRVMRATGTLDMAALQWLGDGTVPDWTPPAPADNGSPWGRALADLLLDLLDGGTDDSQFAEGVETIWPKDRLLTGVAALRGAFRDLSAAVPEFSLSLGHVAGAERAMMPPAASVGWRLVGRHDGWGLLGAPSGRPVVVDGCIQAEFGPDGVARLWCVFDLPAVLAQTGGSL